MTALGGASESDSAHALVYFLRETFDGSLKSFYFAPLTTEYLDCEILNKLKSRLACWFRCKVGKYTNIMILFVMFSF